jgi:hypothetical protein
VKPRATGDFEADERGALMELKNRWVHFRICDVYMPDPRQLLVDLHGNDVLEGRVIDLSDSGLEQEAFAVVEVNGLGQRVIVPVERLLDAD